MNTEADPEIARVLSALADPIRRQILDLLASNGQATATDLAVTLPISRQAITKHLATLESASLVTPHRQGREVLYTTNPAPIITTATWLTRRAETWDTRLMRLAESSE